jgi:hypothetical protein
MRQSPSIVLQSDDRDVYLVLDDFGGRIGQAWRETSFENSNFESVITDLLDGQYSNPIRIIGFNTAKGWSRDVTEDIAQALRRRCDLQLREVPASIHDFIEQHERYDRQQLILRLV